MTTQQKTDARPRKPRQGKQVYDRIREMAISYEFLPDESINEAKLAQTLGVSRSPVRDALNRLVTEGLITFRPNYGFFARSLTDTELFDLAEARLCLELEALGLAFDRGTREEAQELLAFWQEIDAGLDRTAPREAAYADEEFHMRIFRMARNAVLLSMIQSINARIRFIREIEIETPVRAGADFTEHFNIAGALIAGDRDAGIAAMRRHLTFTRDNASAVLREGIVRVYQTRR
ncbi:MAG: GntR family transcriptional regulator [Pseudodonghicola sp.]